MAQALHARARPPPIGLAGSWRPAPGRSLRIGGHRIIYDIDDDAQTVDVFFIGPEGSGLPQVLSRKHPHHQLSF